MRILVAEEDVLTLTFLLRVLLSLGHQVEAVRDGVAAWKVLEKNTSSGLAILNGILPGKSGLDIASDLRASNPSHYTYILLLAPSSEKCEVFEALGAGADGVLTLPATPAELGVHLKVAERVIERESRLHAEIAELRKLLSANGAKRSSLSEDDSGLPARAAGTTEVPDLVSSTVPELSASAEVIPKFLKVDEEKADGIPKALASGLESMVPKSRIEACFADMLRRIRYVAPSSDSSWDWKPDFTVYSALVLEEQCLWLDVEMQMGRLPAQALYRALLAENPTSDAELFDALEEVCNLCQGVWKMVLETAGLQPLTPVLPTARYTRELPPNGTDKLLGSSSFTLPGPIRVTLLERIAVVLNKSLNAIAPGDVLADSISIPNQKMPLLRRGTALSWRYINRIHSLLTAAGDENPTLRVIEPSQLAKLIGV